jgi:hypothetical protein
MQRVSLPGTALTDVPELTNAALEFAYWNPSIGCLIDRVHPCRPLIISFGFADWMTLPPFDFFGRIKKLEQRRGIALNRLLLRDPLNAWYQRGIPGLGTHVDEVVGTLRSLIRSIRPSRVITIGQSMGGYAAIMFGMLLDADPIVAFAPVSHLNPREASCYGDWRYVPTMYRLEEDPPKSCYFDLVSLGRTLDYRGTLHVIFGTHPGNDDGVSGSLDAMHALRLARLAKVKLYPFPEALHTIVKWLVEHKQLDDLLDGLLAEDEAFAGREPTSDSIRQS